MNTQEANQNADAVLPTPLQEAIDQLKRVGSDELDAVMKASVSTTPLYHYTDVAALLSILNDGNMWFTERSHLNDPTEIRFGLEIASRILDEKRGDKAQELFAEEMKLGLMQTLTIFGFCVASFSVDGDSLPQWRAYADDGKGVAIRFAPKITEGGEWPHPCRVQYDQPILEARLRRARDRALSLVSDQSLALLFQSHTKVALNAIAVETALVMLFWCMQFKHRAYITEQELRLIYFARRRRLQEHPGFKTRARRGEVVHYIEDSIHPDFKNGGVLTGIVVGPAAPASLASQLRDTLDAKGYRDVEIRHSELPYRSLRA
jgi:hypothetical protein